MVWKISYEVAGGHTHCRLFTALSPNMTYACCGDFTIRNEELDSLRRAFSGAAFHPVLSKEEAEVEELEVEE